MSDWVVRPEAARYEGREVLGRMAAAAVTQGQAAAVEIVLRDRDGRPVSLLGPGGSSGSSGSSAAGGDYRVRVRLQEACSPSAEPWAADGEVRDGEGGLVRFTLPADAVALPGVLEGQAGVFDGDRLLGAVPFYVLVERGLFGPELARGGAFGERELRLALRDSAPEDSYLNDEREWDLAELCLAQVRPIRTFNDARPPVRRRYTTSTFPYREQWMRAAIGELYRVAAVTYRREMVQYSAAGVALNDKNKAAEYDREAQLRQGQWENFVRVTKVALNAQAAYGHVGLYRPPY